MSKERLLTTDEVLVRLQLNLRTVYRLIKAGRLPAVRVGRQWRFRPNDVEAWVARGGDIPQDDEPRSPASVTALVVDDDEAVLRVTMGYLVRGGFNVLGAHGGEDALARLRERTVDLVVTDLRMPGMNGLELIRNIRKTQPKLPVVVATGHSTEAMAIEALNLGVSAYLRKPVRSKPLLDAVSKAVGGVAGLIAVPESEEELSQSE